MYLALLVAAAFDAHAGDLALAGSSGTRGTGGTGGTGVIVATPPRSPNPQGACLPPGDTSPDPDITVPTHDSSYDLYTQNVEQIDDLLFDNRIPEVGPGMAGVVDLPMTEAPHGLVFVQADDFDAAHMIEHWFVDEPLGSWSGGEDFALQMDKELAFPPATWDVEDGVYMYMDVRYYDTPEEALFNSLTLGYAPSPLLDGWAFDLIQDGEVVGALLREKHANHNWVDFWLFAPAYDRPVDAEEYVQVQAWMAQPATASAFFNALAPLQVNYDQFAMVKYKERNGCAYDAFFGP